MAHFFRNPHKFAVQGIPPGGLGEYDSAEAARQAGLVPASEGEWKAAEAKAAAKAEAESVGGQAKTVAEGAIAGAIDVPLAPARLAGSLVGADLGDMSGRAAVSSAVGVAQSFVDGRDASLAAAANAEAQRTRAEANPLLSGAAELGGSLVGVGAIGKGLSAVEGAAARAAGKTAGAVARGAVEGGVFNVAAEQNRAFLENRELAGEAAWAAMGWGAVLGGAVSGATTKIGDALIGRAARRAERAGQGVTDAEIRAIGKKAIGEEAAPGFEAAFREAAAGKSAALTDRQALRAIAKSTDQEIESAARTVLGGELPAGGFATEARELLAGKSATLARESYLDGATKELTERLDRVAKIANDVSDEVWVTENKAGHVASNFTKGVATDARERTVGLVDEILDDLDIIAEGNAIKFRGKSSIKSLRDSLSEHANALEEATSAEKAYMIGDQARREILNVFESLESAAKTDAAKANPFEHGILAETSRRLGQHYNRTFNFLMDESVWGAQGAAQRGINEAAADYIQAKKFAFPLFTRQAGKEYIEEAVKFRPVYEVDSAKIAGLARRLGEAGNATTEGQFVRALDSAEKFAQQIRKGTVLTNEASEKVAALEAAVKEAKESLSTTATKRRAIDQAEEFVKHVQGERSLAREQASAALGEASQDTLVGSLPGIGPMAAGAVNVVTNPAARLALRLRFERAANRTREAVGFGLDDLFRFVEGRGGKALKDPITPRVTSGAALKLFQGAASSPEKAFTAKREQILAATQNMSGSVRDVGVRYGAHDDPEAHIGFVGAGTRAVNALAAALPGNAMNPASYTPMTANRPPARAEILHFAQLYQAATKPLDIVRSLASGTVTQEQISVVKEVYPALYDHVRSQVMLRLADADRRGKEVPIREARILDTLLDVDHGSTDFAARYGDLMRDVPPPPQGKGGGSPRPGPTKLGASSATMTTTFLGGTAA